MDVNTFLTLLTIISVFTSLFTEAIKKQISGANNVLAGIVAIVISVVACVGYVLYSGAIVNAQLVFTFVILMAMGWLCAMLGYDKVMQTIKQIGGQ